MADRDRGGVVEDGLDPVSPAAVGRPEKPPVVRAIEGPSAAGVETLGLAVGELSTGSPVVVDQEGVTQRGESHVPGHGVVR